ncbi:right-handed parallel beta-helix repeat-containing protein [Bacteroides sp. f07]|uniref:right-handed parallel beta-helix repeat-containing protein n=1 Tax=Bacteroides sp. f07 TaxID=3132704 RepID=UPI0036F42053
MKKNFVLLLCFILAMGMVSCGDDKLDEAIDTEQGGDDGKDDGDDGDDGEKPEPAKAVSWFVAPNGNDSSNGMIATPLKTISKALLRANPGDTVFLREGVYNEHVTPSKSGTRQKRITIKAYKNEVVKIDGTGLKIEGWGNALVQIKDVNFITVENLHICNVINTAKNADPEGIHITGTSNNIEIRGCEIYNVKNTCTRAGQDVNNGLDDWRSAHAILITGFHTTPVRDILIEKCDIHDIHSGTSETFSLVGNVTNFTIQDNKVHDVENIGIIVAGGENLNPGGDLSVNFARDGVIRRNKIYRCTHQNSTDYWGTDAYGAIGIYICGGARTIVEQNEVWGCDRAIGLVSESDQYSTTDCIVRSNIIYNNYRTGIYMGNYIGFFDEVSGTRNCHILNNTLYHNNLVGGSYNGTNNTEGIKDNEDSCEGELRMTKNCYDNVIANNLVYAVTDRDIFVRKYTTSGTGNKISNNIYYSTNPKNKRWVWENVEYTSWEAYKAASGDTGSLFDIDPLLVNPSLSNPNFRLKTGSPAVNAGWFISSYFNGIEDFAGNARYSGSSISIGAYQ